MSAFLAFRAAAACLHSTKVPVTLCLRQQVRSFQGTASVLKSDTVLNILKEGGTKGGKKKGPQRPPINEEIDYRYVQVRYDARLPIEERKKQPLSEPKRLASLLDSLRELRESQRKRQRENPDTPKHEYFVRLVSENPDPIVEILDRVEEYEKDKAARRKARKVAQQSREKEVQVGWGADQNDLDTKFGLTKEYLEKGMRVNLVFMFKKGQRVPSKEGMVTRVEEVVQEFSEISKEWKPREHRFSTASIYLQPLSPAKAEKDAAQEPDDAPAPVTVTQSKAKAERKLREQRRMEKAKAAKAAAPAP